MNKNSIYSKLFFSLSSLIALIIAGALFIAQILSESYSKREIIQILASSMLVYFLTTSLITLINEINKLTDTESGDIKRNLSSIVDTRFAQTIEKFANAHQGFIKGMYDNYPHHFTRIFDEKSKNIYDKINNGERGLYIWMEKIGTETYSDFAISLLELTQDSVLSTTYYDNDQLIENLAKSTGKVISWLNKVNDKKESNPDFTIFRVHMFKRDSSKDECSFFNALMNNPEAHKNYKTKYVLNANHYYTYDIKKTDDYPIFYGEYIIFDKQIMIKYDEDLGVLELYIGQVVKTFVDSFDVSKTALTIGKNKTQIKEILES